MVRRSSVSIGELLAPEILSGEPHDGPHEEPPKSRQGIYFGDEFWKLVMRTIGAPGEAPRLRRGLRQLRRALEADLVPGHHACLVKRQLEKATQAWLREKNGRGRR